MTKKLTLLVLATLFVHFSLSAQLLQPCSPVAKGAASCASACARCTFGTIMGTTDDNTIQSILPDFCGTLTKPEWYAFVAGAASGEFLLNASSCDQGLGLQIALYDDCSTAPLACLAGGGLSLTLPVNNLTIGETYFLLVDGYQGDDCTYTLQAANPALTTAPALGGSPATLPGPVITCPGATVQYCLSQPVAGASHYTWEAPQGAFINGSWSSLLTLPASSGNCVSITFSQISGQVRVTPVTSCSMGATIKRNISVQNQILMQLPLLFVTQDDLPYNWQHGSFMILQGDTTYMLQAVLASQFGCDSVVHQPVIVYQKNTAYGQVYWDVNNNGVYDLSTDYPYTLGAIVQSASGQFGASDPAGKFKVSGLNDQDSVWLTPIPGVTVTPAYQPYNQNLSPWVYRNFGLYPPPPGFDLKTFTSNLNPVRPGFTCAVSVNCKNSGGTAANNVVVKLALPGILQFQSANITPDGMLGDTLFWNVGTMAAGATFNVQITTVCALVPIGTPFQIYSTADGVPGADELNPLNNPFIRHGTVVGSYDPNDKQVDPAYITPDMLSSGQALEYTIRFQNTGNYPAEFVRIIDTLGAGLDPGSFRFLGSSHPCTWKLSGKGVVEFFFKDINLPDSVSNEPESHGFVSFNVRMQPTMGLGDIAENFADIYFDFNDPVRTNTAGTQIVYFLPNNPPSGAGMSARPNPASYMIHFAWLKPLPQAGVLRLFSATGELVRETPVSAGSVGIDVFVADQAQGIYFAMLEAGPVKYVKKVIIQRNALQPVRRPGRE